MPKAKMKRKGAGADLFATDTSRVTSIQFFIMYPKFYRLFCGVSSEKIETVLSFFVMEEF